MKQNVLYFLLIFTIISCAKDSDGNITPPSDASEYCYCTLDGKQYALAIKDGSQGVKSSLHIESSIAPLGQGSSLFKLGSNIFETNNRMEGFGLVKGTMKISQGGFPSDTQFISFMNDQNNVFSPDGLNGIEIKFLDEQQEEWSTSLGSQLGSFFQFTKQVPVSILNEIEIVTEAEFTCKLYNSTGQVKYLENGKSKLIFAYK